MSDAILESGSLEFYKVNEPRVELDNKRDWAILQGSQTTTPYRNPATSFSNTSWVFQIVPPSKQSVLDRVVLIHAPVTLTFTGPGGNTDNILQPGRDALRSHPLSSVISTLTVSLNGTSVSIESQQVVHILERFKQYLEYNRSYGSIFPQMPDNYQVYGDSFGSSNNPLGTYSDNSAQHPRGAYPMIVVANTPTLAIVHFELYEYVILPPFLYGGDDMGHIREAGGLTYLDTFNLTCTLNNNLARLWSHALSGLSPSTSVISTLSVTFQQPELLLWWLTPRLLQSIPKEIVYPYFQISRYTTQGGANAINPNGTFSMTSNVIQFQTIPLKIYVCAQRSQNLIYQTLSSTISSSDTFSRIDGVSVNFNNISGLLSNASPQHLYEMSLQNGLSMSYNEWIGSTEYLSAVAGQTTRFVGTVGGVLCIDPAKDFGLSSELAEGTLGQFNFQIIFNGTNMNQVDIIDFELYIVAVYDGILTLANNSGTTQQGVVTRQDVLTAPMHHMNYNELTSIYGGGSFFSKFGDILRKGANYVKDNKLISKGLGIIPHPYAQLGSQAANILGLGEGGVLEGGRPMTRKMMRKRLK